MIDFSVKVLSFDKTYADIACNEIVSLTSENFTFYLMQILLKCMFLCKLIWESNPDNDINTKK